MEALLGRLGELGSWAYVIVGALAFLETSAFVGLLAPGETAVILGGFVAAHSDLSAVGVAASASIGATLGDSVGYEIGRHFGWPLLLRWRRRRRALEHAQRVFERHGGKAVFFGRFVGFLRAFAPLLAGIARMPYPRFLVYNIGGAVLWASACTVLGYVAGANWRVIERWITWIGTGVAIAVAVFLVVRWRSRARAGRTADVAAPRVQKPHARRLLVSGGVPLVVGLALIVLLVWLTGPAAVLATLRQLSAWEGLVLVATAFASSAFAAGALRVILGRYGHTVSTWLLFRLAILAFAVGWLIPSGYVAGFPVAAWVLSRRGVPFGRALASLLIERFFELGAYTLVLPTVLLTELPSGAAMLAGVFTPILALTIVCLDLVLGWRLGRRSLAALAPRAPLVVAPAFERSIDFLGTVSSFFQSSVLLLLAAVALSVLAISASFARAVLTAQFLHLPLGVPEVALLVAFSLVILAIPFLPGAIGIYEGGMVGFFRLLGRPATEGIAYAMAVHGVELVVAAVGVVFLVQLGVSLTSAEEIAAAPVATAPTHDGPA